MKSNQKILIEELEKREELAIVNLTGPIKWPPPIIDQWPD